MGVTLPGCSYRLGAVTLAVVTGLSAAPAEGPGTWGGLLKASYHAMPSHSMCAWVDMPSGYGDRLGAGQSENRYGIVP